MLYRLQSYLQMLRTDPLGFVVYLAYYVVVLLLSLNVHALCRARRKAEQRQLDRAA